MILKDKLYHIKGMEVIDDCPQYTIAWQADHIIYQAHFPEEPITPGVCIIQVAQELLDDYAQQHYVVQQVKNVKFLNIISPLETPCVKYVFDKIEISDDQEDCKIVVQVRTEDMVFTKLSLICKKAVE